MTLTKSQLERIEGLTSITALKSFTEQVNIITENMLDEGWVAEEARDYLVYLIEKNLHLIKDADPVS